MVDYTAVMIAVTAGLAAMVATVVVLPQELIPFDTGAAWDWGLGTALGTGLGLDLGVQRAAPTSTPEPKTGWNGW